jgi:hypothetical protein
LLVGEAMMRAALLMVIAGVCKGRVCDGDGCPVMYDTSNLIQKHQAVADFEFEDGPDDENSGWSNTFGNLMDKLSPDAITEKIDKIIEDNSVSLQSAQDKIFGLAHEFGSRVNQTMEAAQDRLGALQDVINTNIEKGRKLKDRGIIQAVTMITKMGDAAVDVARKVTVEVEEGQLKVRQMVTLLKSEKVESRRQEMQQSLDIAVYTLTGLENALREAMRRGDNDADLMQLDTNATSNVSKPDLTSAAIEKAEQLLLRTDKLLDDAKVYIDFVQSRVDSVREEATRLVEEANNQTDDAFDHGTDVVQDVMKKLGEIDSMLAGKMSVTDAKVIMSHNSAAQAGVSLLLCLFSAAVIA